MGKSIEVSIADVKIRLVDGGTDGLIAWASCVVAHAIQLDNIAIRRGRDGSLFLTYPNKRIEATGRTHSFFHPISSEAAEAVQNAILAKLAGLARAAQAQEDRAS